MVSLLSHLSAALPQSGRPRPRLFALRQQEGAVPISLGLVNIMPDSALVSTERQIRALLKDASMMHPIKLTVFTMNDILRGEVGRRYIRDQTAGTKALWDAKLDGLIVTGTEPQAKKLTDEPYWLEMARLVDWAEANTLSTMWCCLSAHAAVLHHDGIERQRLGRKLFGVFDCAPAWRRSTEPRAPGFADRRAARRERDLPGELLAHMPRHWVMPHSRCNDLSRDHLAAHGYEIISASDHAGVDLFARQRRSLFMFVQGHPEYDAQTLLREYRRDVSRFYTNGTEYPEMPQGYFDAATERLLESLQSRALRDRRIDPVPLLAEAAYGSVLRHRWQAAAVTLYTNWLNAISTRRVARANALNAMTGGVTAQEGAAAQVGAAQAGAAQVGAPQLAGAEVKSPAFSSLFHTGVG